jgi:D-alanyl-D-alanine carboxypeptidase
MKKSAITIFFLIAVILKSQSQVSPYLTGRFQFVLDSVCAKYNIKGTSAAILIPNVGIWKGANGISEEGTPITTNMLFGMGSNTKTHIAAVLLKMQEQQLLSLDDSIGKWISGFPNINSKITIRQCLNHTSGLFDYMQNNSINDSIFSKPEKVWQRNDILNLVQAPNFMPGKSWDYSNTNYIIAGIIIESVMKKSPFKVIDELLLKPHNLVNTFNYGEQGAMPIAHPWSISMDGKALTDMTKTPFLNNLFSLANTAGSLITTAEDNVQFWHKLFSGQMLNKQSWKEMTTMFNIGNNANYGLGIFRFNRLFNGRTAYSHGGTFFGYINENIVDTTSGISIAVFTNQDSVNNNGLLNLVISALHKVTLNMPATAVNELPEFDAIKVFPNPANSYLNIGTCDNLNINAISIYDNKGTLVYEKNGNINEINLEQFSEGLYFVNLNCQNQVLRKKFIISR